MRTLARWTVVVSVLAAGLLWGWSVSRASAPPRPQDLTAVVDSTWYQNLPIDASTATRAYLARIPAQMTARGEAYSDSRFRAFILRVVCLLVASVFISASGMAAGMRQLGLRLSAVPVVSDAAVAVQYFVAMYCLSLPAEIYARFVRPHRFGFSDQSFSSWLSDDLANWGVFALFYLVAVLLIFRLIRRKPKSWVLGAMGIYVVLRSLFALLSPNFIEPLTNDFKPLPDGPQKRIITALARANGINQPNVVFSNASAQYRTLNAHVSGLGQTARISVDDTTLAQTSPPMLKAVVAHEIGHFVLDHEAMGVVTDSLMMGVGFLAIAIGTGAVVRRCGPSWHMQGTEDIATLPIFWGLFLLWGFVSLPATNAISRVYEHQADLFALNASQSPFGLADFMIHDADIARLEPTPIEYALFYDHPSDAERVALAMVWRDENQKLTAP